MTVSTNVDDRPELVFGLVGPIGVDVPGLIAEISTAAEAVAYRVQTIDLMKEIQGILPKMGWEHEIPTAICAKYRAKMDLGNRLRGELKRNDAAALIGIAAIRADREKTDQPRPTIYVLKQLKTTAEVESLRSVYGANCIIVSAYASRSDRELILSKQIARSENEQMSDKHRAKAVELIARDQSEAIPHGQDVQGAFPLSDIFVNASSRERARPQVVRLIEILFGHPVRTPRRDEFGMFQAFGSGLRSSDMGRQVGAAICSCEGELISVGVNEVPRAHGGQYWEEDDEDLDNRDWRRPSDSNAHILRGILADLIKRMIHRGWIDASKKNVPLASEVDLRVIEQELTEPISTNQDLAEKAQIRNIIEFFRAVHAEMSAITSAARRGASINGGTMYVTAFPCHECAKHIVAAGVTRVVFIEPYPKSRVPDLYDDSISIDGTSTKNRINFEAFVGVAPRKYAEWFLMPKRRTKGKWTEWSQVRRTATPRNARAYSAYSEAENNLIVEIKDAIERTRGNHGATQ